MSSDIEQAKAITLQKIGRNVVVFSRLEHQLTGLVRNTRVSGSVSKLTASNAKTQRKFPKLSLGRLAEELWKNLFASHTPNSRPEEIEEPWISQLLQVEMEKADQKRWKQSLDSLVTSRNNLVHKKLPKLDFNSMEVCAALDQELDDQYIKICEHIEEFNNLARSFQDMQRELGEALKTGNFVLIEEENPRDA